MREEQHHKGWNEIKTNDSWAIFKIMGEFVNGYEKLSKIGPCVSIFGSARTKPDHKYYKLAEEMATKIVNHGYGVITGGGPGIMEAGNKGAHSAGGTSVGLNIELPFEQNNNPYIDSDKSLDFDYYTLKNNLVRLLLGGGDGGQLNVYFFLFFCLCLTLPGLILRF